MEKMKVLIIGSGGREHGFCWKVAQSPLVKKVYCMSGNAGIEQIAECVNPPDVVLFCKENNIDFVIVGPEAPLVDGIVDKLENAGIKAFGPNKKAAQLEGSKVFMKDTCKKYGIPTAKYKSFNELQKAKNYLNEIDYPIVIKTDGLAAGKGVLIVENQDDAERELDEVFNGKFGDAGLKIVIEEFLEGEEVSVFYACTDKGVVELGAAQDHKRVGEGDTGLNTGGMGAYSPTPIYTDEIKKETFEKIIIPTLKGMEAEDCPFKGFLFAGLMLTKNGVKLLEFNVRMGDPETQVILPRMETDLVSILLGETTECKLSDKHAICVVMASNGYPEEYEKGSVIGNLDEVSDIYDVLVFHAGTKKDGDKILANGGRVLGITGLGDTLNDAKKVYKAIEKIDWKEGFYRKDIGWRVDKN